MFRLSLDLTTATDGTVTAATGAVLGALYCIEYQPGTIAAGADLVITCEADASKPLLTFANAGTAGWWKYPRDHVHAVSDGTPLTGNDGGSRVMPIINGRLQVVVAQGGSAKTGKVLFYIEEID